MYVTIKARFVTTATKSCCSATCFYSSQSVTLDGKAIDPQKNYRVATLDYLAQGNDGLTAFKSKTNVVSPTGEANDVRHVIVKYFDEKKAQGQAVDSKVEGRVTVE